MYKLLWFYRKISKTKRICNTYFSDCEIAKMMFKHCNKIQKPEIELCLCDQWIFISDARVTKMGNENISSLGGVRKARYSWDNLGVQSSPIVIWKRFHLHIGTILRCYKLKKQSPGRLWGPFLFLLLPMRRVVLLCLRLFKIQSLYNPSQSLAAMSSLSAGEYSCMSYIFIQACDA